MKTKAEKLEASRIQREKYKVPRDWPQLTWAYVLHGVEGAVAGVIAMVSVFQSNVALSVFALTLTMMYVAYQGLSFARKRDTVGRDLMDYAMGWAFGALVALFFYGDWRCFL